MKPVADHFTSWIDRLPKWQGWLQLSPARPFMHAEEEYDAHYGLTAPDVTEGQGLCELIKSSGVDTAGPALEIGCGSGYLTFGFAQHYPGPDILLTDPSPAFLRLTQRLFEGNSSASARRHYGVLNADDAALLPPEMFSVIALRSTLHHILKVDNFVAACARSLLPGGALIMGAEPCESGYVLMGTVARAIPLALQAAGIAMRPEWMAKVDELSDTVKFYCLRDLDKTNAEDKHLFTPHGIAELGAAHGLTLKFYPTAAFRDFAPPYIHSFHCFSHFFLIYLQYCMRCESEFVDLVRIHLKDVLSYVDECHRSHPGPDITGVFVLKKTS